MNIDARSLALARQFITFALIGVVNTGVSFGTYAFFTRVVGLQPLVANAAAFLIAVTVSFILNRRYTFKGSLGRLHHQYGKFIAVNVVGLGFSELIIWFLHVRHGLHDFLAFGIATVIVLFWNFGVNRWWTFK